VPAVERKRVRKEPAVRREEILGAAAGLFLKNGVQATSMAQVAESAGVAKGTPYVYFDSKDELLAALRDNYLGEWYGKAEGLLSDPAPGQEVAQLEGFLRAMYEFHADKVELHHLLMSGEGAEDQIFAQLRKLLAEFLDTGVERSVFSVSNLAATVDFVLHGLHGILVCHLHEGRSSEEFASDAMGVLMPLLKGAG
jgi:TetR/AcrR family transcriptional regulator, transcriptional repressor for nem operon